MSLLTGAVSAAGRGCTGEPCRSGPTARWTLSYRWLLLCTIILQLVDYRVIAYSSSISFAVQVLRTADRIRAQRS